MILVYLTLDRAQYTPFDAHYVPTVDVPFVRLSEPKNYRDGPDPHHRTVLCAEVPASPGDPLWTAPDDDLTAVVSDGIRPASACLQSGPRRCTQYGCHACTPRYDNDQVAQLNATVRRAGNIPGVTLLGRQGLAVIDNLHHVLDMSRTAVDCLGQDGGLGREALGSGAIDLRGPRRRRLKRPGLKTPRPESPWPESPRAEHLGQRVGPPQHQQPGQDRRQGHEDEGEHAGLGPEGIRGRSPHLGRQ